MKKTVYLQTFKFIGATVSEFCFFVKINEQIIFLCTRKPVYLQNVRFIGAFFSSKRYIICSLTLLLLVKQLIMGPDNTL